MRPEIGLQEEADDMEAKYDPNDRYCQRQIMSGDYASELVDGRGSRDKLCVVKTTVYTHRMAFSSKPLPDLLR